MENAVDALKIAFAVFVFVIALALALSVIGQVKEISDVILALGDKTNEYEYVELSDSNANNKDRIVGFETILPTIYRYPSERYAVTILDEDGIPIVRYDLFTENFMNNWDRTLSAMRSPSRRGEVQSNYDAIKERISIVDEMLQKEFGLDDYHGIWNSLVNESGYISGNLYGVTASDGRNIKQGAPWGSDTPEILKRIKADLSTKNDEKEYTRDNIIIYQGKDLNQYRNKQFKEKFIEIQISGTTITEDEYSLETVKGSKTLEIVYIMQKGN